MQEERKEKVFYYPENLTEKATYIAGWEWWALLIIAAGFLLSLLLILTMGLMIPMVITAMFAICTLKISGISVYGMIKIFANFVFADQMIYFWSAKEGVDNEK